jgi:hypothetical protein
MPTCSTCPAAAAHRFSGCDFRLTDVSGEVMDDIIAYEAGMRRSCRIVA